MTKGHVQEKYPVTERWQTRVPRPVKIQWICCAAAVMLWAFCHKCVYWHNNEEQTTRWKTTHTQGHTHTTEMLALWHGAPAFTSPVNAVFFQPLSSLIITRPTCKSVGHSCPNVSQWTRLQKRWISHSDKQPCVQRANLEGTCLSFLVWPPTKLTSLYFHMWFVYVHTVHKQQSDVAHGNLPSHHEKSLIWASITAAKDGLCSGSAFQLRS